MYSIDKKPSVIEDNSAVIHHAVAACFITLMNHEGNADNFRPEFRGNRLRNTGTIHTCNAGFYVSEIGHYWSYSEGDSSCQNQGHSCYLIQIDPSDQTPPTINVGISIVALSRAGRKTNLVIGQSRVPPKAFLSLPQRPLSVGDAVYAIGNIDNHFLVTKGHVIEIAPASDDNDHTGQIKCALQVYHGFCGCPLITASGHLVGLGAKHGGLAETGPKGGEPYRRFDVGIFDNAFDLMRIHRTFAPERSNVSRSRVHSGPQVK
jgi:hypothetical protein